MNDELAHERLTEVLNLIDRWGDLYERRWGHKPPHYQKHPELDSEVDALTDKVRARTKLAHDVIAAMGREDLAKRVVEHEEGEYGGHPFTQARKAIVEAIAILAQREELAEIVGPVGPRLSASELHQVVWGAAAGLWDDGHFRQAVQTAASALEGLLQPVAGPGVSGENLANLFSINDPTQECHAFDFAVSTPTPSRRRGNQLTRARPHWSAGLLWASATSCLIPDGPSRLPVRPLRCSPF